MRLSRQERRLKRHQRIRKKVFGTPEKPRLFIYRSVHNLYASLIDDTTGKTITTISTISPAFIEKYGKRGGKSIEDAQKLAELVVEKAKSLGIEKVVFDRGGFLYHGKIKAFADKCRELGLLN